MTTIENVEQFCRENALVTGLLVEQTQLSAYIHTGAVGARLVIRHSDDVLRVQIAIPIFVPLYHRAAMAEALARANWDLAGAFVMDYSDGEIRYKVSIPLYEAVPNDNQLRWLIFGCINTVDCYSMALMEVATGATTAEHAINRAEASFMEEMKEKIEVEEGTETN